MTATSDPAPSWHPDHGHVTYLQLPAREIERSAHFYQHVFGWITETAFGSFQSPGLIGQFTTERSPAGAAGPVLWLAVGDIYRAMREVEAHHGTIASRPRLDQGARWLVEIDDPAGNRIGIVAPARQARPQPLLTVRDVEASSAFYQHLLGLTSDHGGPDYERLLSDGELVLQLHHPDIAHGHGPLGSPDAPVGHGVLVWFGEVADFDGAVARAVFLGASVVMPPHRNPPEGGGNGPAHREAWITDPDGYVIVIASPDGEAWELPARA